MLHTTQNATQAAPSSPAELAPRASLVVTPELSSTILAPLLDFDVKLSQFQKSVAAYGHELLPNFGDIHKGMLAANRIRQLTYQEFLDGKGWDPRGAKKAFFNTMNLWVATDEAPPVISQTEEGFLTLQARALVFLELHKDHYTTHVAPHCRNIRKTAEAALGALDLLKQERYGPTELLAVVGSFLRAAQIVFGRISSQEHFIDQLQRGSTFHFYERPLNEMKKPERELRDTTHFLRVYDLWRQVFASISPDESGTLSANALSNLREFLPPSRVLALTELQAQGIALRSRALSGEVRQHFASIAEPTANMIAEVAVRSNFSPPDLLALVTYAERAALRFGVPVEALLLSWARSPEPNSTHDKGTIERALHTLVFLQARLGPKFSLHDVPSAALLTPPAGWAALADSLADPRTI